MKTPLAPFVLVLLVLLVLVGRVHDAQAAEQRPLAIGVDAVIDRYGLSREEATQRLRDEAVASSVASNLRQSHSDWLSGTWLDPVTGLQYVGVTESNLSEKVLSAYKSANYPNPPVVVQQKYSLTELESAGKEALRIAQKEFREHIGLVALRLDEQNNRQIIWVSRDANDVVVSLFRESLKARELPVVIDVVNPEMITSSALACGAPDCDRPLRGGVSLSAANSPVCSSGFFAKSASYLYLITAGHCARNVYTWSAHAPSYSPFWQVIGPNLAVLSNFGPSDYAAIRINASSFWSPNTPGGYFQNWAGNYPTGSLGTYTNATQPQQGAWICRYGYKSHYSCGQITNASISMYVDHVVVVDLFESDACVMPGDSGGLAIDAGNGSLKGTVTSGDSFCPTIPGALNRGISTFYKALNTLSQTGLTLVL
jgi:hypothetical protein